MTVLIYDHPLSPYGQKVKIALLEKGVPFEAQLPTNLGSGEVADNFAAASPRGEVPALIDGDVTVFDSTIILEYIEDRWPEPALLPRDAAARARSRMIEETMDTHYEAINWGLGEVTYFGRGDADALGAFAARETAAWQAWLARQLGDRPWFEGDTFGWADLAVIPYINGSTGFGLGPAADSPLANWQARANQRASVAQVSAAAETMAMGGSEAAEAGMAVVRELLERGEFKREYRDHRLEWMVRGGALEVVRDGLERDNIRFTEPFGQTIFADK